MDTKSVQTRKVYECGVCLKTFLGENHLKTHSQYYRSKIDNKCYICKKEYKSLSTLRHHLKRKHLALSKAKLDDNECDICKAKFKSPPQLRNHMRANHITSALIRVQTRKVYECGICLKTFFRENHLKIHSQLHRSKIDNKCYICQKEYKSLSTLRRHLKRKHFALSKAKLDDNECDICKVKFKSPPQLRNHIRANHITSALALGTTEDAYKCSICKEIFDKYDVESHIQIHMIRKVSESLEEKIYKCHMCNRTFAESLELKEHYEQHKNGKGSEKPYKCDVCCREFTTVGHLKTHVRIHTGEQPFSCTYCGKLFRHRNTWKRHEEISHNNETSAIAGSSESGTKSVDSITITFDCNICQESFPEKNLMIDHRRIHEQVRSFECNICKNTFDQSDGLEFHLRKCHVNERILVGMDKILYDCENCKQTFENLDDLGNHLNIYMNKKVSDNCKISGNAAINSILEEAGSSMTETIPSTSTLVKKKYILPLGVRMFLLPHGNTVKVASGFQNQAGDSPAILVPIAQNAIVPVIVNSETQLTKTAVSVGNNSQIHDDCLAQQVENNLVQQSNDTVDSTMKNSLFHLAETTVVKNGNISNNSDCTTQVVHTDIKCNFDTDLLQINKSSNIAVDKITPVQSYLDDAAKAASSTNYVILQLTETENRKFQYDCCQMNCRTESQLLTHKKKKHRSELSMYKCDVCQAVCRSNKNLLEHKLTHKAAYKCEICKKHFMQAHNLHKHLLVCHVTTHYTNGVQSYECGICKNTFRKKGDVEIHVKIHVNNNFGKKVAPECNSSSGALGSELSTHAKTHSGEYGRGESEKFCEYTQCDRTKYINKKTHECDICYKLFTTVRHLKAHGRIHTGLNPFSCSMCEEKFPFQSSLKYHCMAKHSIEEFDGCEQNVEIDCVDRISAVDLKKESHKCSLCELTFEELGDLILHLKTHSYGFAKCNFVCYICYKIFPYRQLLVDHKKDHAQFRQYECSICKREYSHQYEVMKHLKEKHINIKFSLDKGKLYQCFDCCENFKSLPEIRIHLKTHVFNRIADMKLDLSKIYKCDFCDQTFVAKSALDDHLKSHDLVSAEENISVETHREEYNCNVCDATFLFCDQLEKHLKVHVGDIEVTNIPSNEKMFVCKLCGKSYMLERYLTVHMQNIHVTCEKKYKCDICQRKYHTQTQFTLHKKLHTREKQYIYNFRNKAYTYVSALYTHTEAYSKVSPFKCNICKKKFICKNYLVRHKRVHSCYKHYVCVFCHKPFTDLVFLKTHFRFHTREKPFECIICLKQFYVNWMLLRHEKLHLKH